MADIVPSLKTNPDFTLGKAFMIGIAKIVTERALANVRFVGNGTIRSGVVKGIMATAIYAVGRKSSGVLKSIAEIESTALTIDAVEDIAGAVMNMYFLKSNARASTVTSPL